MADTHESAAFVVPAPRIPSPADRGLDPMSAPFRLTSPPGAPDEPSSGETGEGAGETEGAPSEAAAPEPADPAAEARKRRIAGRLVGLRAELEASTDRTRRAHLLHEIAATEQAYGNEAQAVKDYLAAFNAQPSFRAPLFALTQVFERRRSLRNLLRLYEAEAKAAPGPVDRASALVDKGILLEDHLSSPGEAVAAFEEAVGDDATSRAGWMMLEQRHAVAQDGLPISTVLEARARLATDPSLRSVLLAEVAVERESEGDVDGAAAALREAAVALPCRWRMLSALERLAARHERAQEQAETLEAMATFAEARSSSSTTMSEGGPGEGIDAPAEPEECPGVAVDLLRRAALLRGLRLERPNDAVELYDRALAHRPGDVLLLREQMMMVELAGDLARSAGIARTLLDQLEQSADGPSAAALRMRLAEAHVASGDLAAARKELALALESDPASLSVRAFLEDMLLDAGDVAATAELYASHDRDGVAPSARIGAQWRAAELWERRAGNSAQAVAAYEAALARAQAARTDGPRADDTVVVLRRDLVAAVLRGVGGATDAAKAADAVDALLAEPIEDDEHAALSRELFRLCRGPLADHTRAAAALDASIARGGPASRWALEARRALAVEERNWKVLADAHRALAAASTDDLLAAAHLSAAGRALSRGGEDHAASEAFAAALEKHAASPYAVAGRVEALRASGAAAEVVELLRRAAEAEAEAGAAETRLLLAGAAAEAAGDLDGAVRTYEEAADRNQTSPGPLLAMRRLAEKRGDAGLLLHVREALAEREAAAERPGRATLELAEHYDLVAGKPELAEDPLRRAIDDPHVGPIAALELALMPQATPDATLRALAIERLQADADGDAVRWIARELGGLALSGQRDLELADRAVEATLAAQPDDRWALLARLRLVASEPSRVPERARSLLALASAIKDPTARTSLRTAALRAQSASRGAGDDATDDLLLAAEIAEQAPDAPQAAIAMDEALGTDAEPGAVAEAIGMRAKATSASLSADLLCSHALALEIAGRFGDAVSVAQRVLEVRSDDAVALDTLRVSARETEQWVEVARSCDGLARLSVGLPEAALFHEEGGVVRMDQLGDAAGAEARFRASLSVDPKRDVAYGRLHDLLEQRNDTAALEALVSARIDVTDDSEELTKLFWERARLLRAMGDIDGSASALESVLVFEPSHVGALALSSEIHVQRGDWASAIDALRGLATADIPANQRRAARLGASDFLDKHLGDHAAALAEIAAVADLGLLDEPVASRAVEIALRGRLWDDAVEYLRIAAELTTSAAIRARYERRAGDIHRDHRSDPSAAIAAYRRALASVPDDLAAAASLMDLVSDPAMRDDALRRFEVAVRQALETEPTEAEPLRALVKIGEWRSDEALRLGALDALVALGHATPEEQAEQSRLLTRTPPEPTRPLTEEIVNRLIADPRDRGPYAELLRTVGSVIAEADRLEPARFGVSRSNKISPKTAHPVRDRVIGIARGLGIGELDVYVGGDDPGRVVGLPGDPPCIVVGSGVAAPLTPLRRFEVARALAAVRRGVATVLVRRPDDALVAFVAAVAAAGVPVTAPAGARGYDETLRAMTKAMSRKVRKVVPDLARQAGGSPGRPEDAVQGAKRTIDRVGAVWAGELSVVLDRLVDGPLSPGAVRASAEGRAMLLFWTSSAMATLRRELGLIGS
ncbi:MAG: hypothetical protein IT379_38255 [Deltaproteobacteria bacterium]|nr:hypothetical protein [Deltaproteobacteria bacterium]